MLVTFSLAFLKVLFLVLSSSAYTLCLFAPFCVTTTSDMQSMLMTLNSTVLLMQVLHQRHFKKSSGAFKTYAPGWFATSLRLMMIKQNFSSFLHLGPKMISTPHSRLVMLLLNPLLHVAILVFILTNICPWNLTLQMYAAVWCSIFVALLQFALCWQNLLHPSWFIPWLLQGLITVILCYGLPDTLLSKLQRVQNVAARIIRRCERTSHIRPVLQDLHWLPVKYRIVFKVLLITFRTLQGSAPEYLSDLITPYTPQRCLRSSSRNLLTVPKCGLSLMVKGLLSTLLQKSGTLYLMMLSHVFPSILSKLSLKLIFLSSVFIHNSCWSFSFSMFPFVFSPSMPFYSYYFCALFCFVSAFFFYVHLVQSSEHTVDTWL